MLGEHSCSESEKLLERYFAPTPLTVAGALYALRAILLLKGHLLLN